MFAYRRRYSILFKAIAIVLLCLFLVNDAVLAQPSPSVIASPAVFWRGEAISNTSTLAPELRLKPFSDAHGLAFRDLLTAAYVAREMRDTAVNGKLRESHIIAFNKRFPKGEIKIHREIETGSLVSGKRYALAVFEFVGEKKQINVLLLKDYANLTAGDREELKKFGIKTDTDISHLSYQGLEGVWFVNSASASLNNLYSNTNILDTHLQASDALGNVLRQIWNYGSEGFPTKASLERREILLRAYPEIADKIKKYLKSEYPDRNFDNLPIAITIGGSTSLGLAINDSDLDVYILIDDSAVGMELWKQKNHRPAITRLARGIINQMVIETGYEVRRLHPTKIQGDKVGFVSKMLKKPQYRRNAKWVANAFLVNVGDIETIRAKIINGISSMPHPEGLWDMARRKWRSYVNNKHLDRLKPGIAPLNLDLPGFAEISAAAPYALVLAEPASGDATKPKGSCADCLNSIIGNDALLEKALTEGLDIETDLKPARLKLKNPDQPFSDTTIYNREINTLIDLGIIIRLPDGKIKFSDMIIKPDNKGPPDKEYTKNLIRLINEIEYPIGQKGPYKNKPMHRGEIPPQIRPKIKELVLKIAQPPADGSGYSANLPAANAVRFLLEDGFLSLEEFQKIMDEPSLKSFGTHAIYKEILIRCFFDKEIETTIVSDLQKRGIAIKKISSTTFMRWLARIYNSEIIKDKLQRIKTSLPYIPQANNIRRMLEFRYGLYDDGKPLHKNETAVKIGRTLPYVEARLKIALPLMKALMSGENEPAAKQLSSFAEDLRPGRGWTSELIKEAKKEIREIINKLAPGLAKTELAEESLSVRPARTIMGADKYEYIIKYVTTHLHKMATEKAAWGDAAKCAVQSLNALNDYAVIYPDKLRNMAYELEEAIDDASKKYPDGIKERLRKKLLKILDALIRNSSLHDSDELDGDYSGDPVSPFGSPALNTPYIVNQILEDNPNISFDDLLNKIAEHLGVSSINDLKAYPNLKEEIKEHLATISRLGREMVTEAAHGEAGKDSGLAKIDINTASFEELQRLFAKIVLSSERVLHNLTQRVIDERTKKPFTSLDDVANRVKGIGSSTAERLRGRILISGKPIELSLLRAVKGRSIIFTNYTFESASDKINEPSTERYHDIITRALSYDDEFVRRTLNAMGTPNIEKFMPYKKAEITFLGIGVYARIYKVTLQSKDDKAEFVITLGKSDCRTEFEEAEKDRRDGFSPRILKNEFDNLVRMNNKFPENVVMPYAYAEIESKDGSAFPLYSMRSIRDYDGFHLCLDGNKLRATSRIVADRLWQMEGNELRKLLKEIFKIRIKLFLEFHELFVVDIPSADFMYPSQRTAVYKGPYISFNGSVFKTVPYDAAKPIILTAAIASIKCDEAHMAFALIGEGQVLMLQPFHDIKTVVIPAYDAITALSDALSEIFPAEGKRKAAEWLRACLAQYGDEIPPDTAAIVRKSVDNLNKNKPDDILSARERADAMAREETTRIHEADLKPEYMPAIPEKTILCHIITDSILPEGQRNMLKTLEQNMRGSEYSEKIISFSINDPDNFVEELSALMAKQREFYKGYVVNFDVACPNIDIVIKILGSNLSVKALAFEPCKEIEFDIAQVEGIILALRALNSGRIENLREAFKILTGKDLPQELLALTDINEFIKRITFTLPASKIIDYNHRRQLNEIIRKNIESAA